MGITHVASGYTRSNRWPVFSSRRQSLPFSWLTTLQHPSEESGIYAGSLDTGQVKLIEAIRRLPVMRLTWSPVTCSTFAMAS